jgi:uncharacterized membrane protein
MFPPVPSWDGFHPILSHFPIALLTVAPLFIIIGLLKKEDSRSFMISAFILMCIGTIAIYLSASSGDSAAELVKKTPEIDAVLQQHEAMGELVRTLFTIVTALFAVLLFVPRLLHKKLAVRSFTWLAVAILIINSCCVIYMYNAAHEGGRLVHIYGVHASMEEHPPTPDLRK